MVPCRYRAYCASSDFIREHVFPGGHLLCMGAISSLVAEQNLKISNTNDIGLDYALTLRQWRQNWVERKKELLEIGCDPRQHRMFEVYFAYCEAGFDSKYIHTHQITMQKTHCVAEETSTQHQTTDTLTQVTPCLFPVLF